MMFAARRVCVLFLFNFKLFSALEIFENFETDRSRQFYLCDSIFVWSILLIAGPDLFILKFLSASYNCCIFNVSLSLLLCPFAALQASLCTALP